MRYTLIFLGFCFILTSCGKDKYTSAPQLTYKSINPERVNRGIIIGGDDPFPVITLTVTDAEGDLGFKTGSDTSRIYIKNLLINRVDSFFLPDIQTVATKNFQGDIRISTVEILRGSSPAPPRGKADTIYYEMYVVDFAKQRSNVITAGPLYYVTP